MNLNNSFKSLQHAIFLRRINNNIIEADANSMKISLYCPNNSTLANCAVLGSNIWYSPAVYTPVFVPATWQLAEVDYGNLVLVNNKLCSDLFLEGLVNNIIKINKLNIEDVIIAPNDRLFRNYIYDYNLINRDNNSNFYINITSSTFNRCQSKSNMTFTNYFPEASCVDVREELYDLIQARTMGHRAALCCLVLNQGTDKLCLSSKYDSAYAKLLSLALKLGVEFMAYRVDINETEVKIAESVDVKH